jgi:hypothetical protein
LFRIDTVIAGSVVLSIAGESYSVVVYLDFQQSGPCEASTQPCLVQAPASNFFHII